MELRLEVASFTTKIDVLFVVVTHTAIPERNVLYGKRNTTIELDRIHRE